MLYVISYSQIIHFINVHLQDKYLILTYDSINFLHSYPHRLLHLTTALYSNQCLLDFNLFILVLFKPLYCRISKPLDRSTQGYCCVYTSLPAFDMPIWYITFNRCQHHLFSDVGIRMDSQWTRAISSF